MSRHGKKEGLCNADFGSDRKRPRDEAMSKRQHDASFVEH